MVSRSTTDAKLALTTCTILWLQCLLKELRVSQDKTPIIWCGNLGTVDVFANPFLYSRMKHIELVFFFVREKVLNKMLVVNHVLSSNNRLEAYMFTKPLLFCTASHLEIVFPYSYISRNTLLYNEPILSFHQFKYFF